ncbi:LamG-like jellyroll fold domain-containing protein [Nocardiopsis sp. NPDC058789]|uniref:LamG-like jellyroll fold domain-containing protein n=1 Tax=Nocardiopsis sp. NPDC058789 TaxID=3346634 RepID=UPI00366AB88B
MRRSVTRATAVSTAVALALSLLFAPPAAADPDPPDSTVDEATEDMDALEVAKETGEPVAIPGLTDEKTQHFANPDGTFTAEASMLPVRVRSESGWMDVDTALTQSDDGLVRPRAAGMDIAFSGGGDDAMVHIGIGSNSVRLGWIGDLPEPVLDGDQATYPDVLPDVDLVLTAGVEGFTQVLVVNTPEAAQLPELAELELPLDTTGVTMTADEHGNLDAVGDLGGESVFSAEAPAMWDSTVEEEGADDPTVAAPLGARVQSVDTSVTVDAIRLVPDQGMLVDEATEFPVYIDPSVNASRPNWGYVDSAYVNQSYFNPSRDSVGVGRYSGPEGTFTRRAFFQFTVMARTNQAHTTINSATLRTEVDWAYNCNSDSRIQLQRVSAFNRNSTWRNAPATQGGVVDTQNVRGGWATCPSSSGVEFDATSAYRWGVNNNASHIYLRLKERDEQGTAAWRRFNTKSKPPVLVVNYNNPPAQVSTATMSDSLGGACSTDKSKPRLINNTTTTFRATVRDYDARAAWGGQKLKARVAWWADGEGDQLGNADSSYADVGYWPEGSERAVTVSGLPENQLLGYRAMAHDEVAWSPSWSGWCWIKIDTTKPDTGPKVTSTAYPADDDLHGSVGRTGDFTFDNNGVEEATSYYYSLNDTSCTTEVKLDQPGASSTVPITPSRGGANMIYARTVDAYGNSSECELAYYFLVAPPSSPISHLPLGEGQGDTVADSANSDRVLTATGEFSWTRGRVAERAQRGHRLEGAAIDIDGENARLVSDEPVIDTSKSFSVSTWVRMDDKDRNRSAVAQTGLENSGFYLGYQQTLGHDRWVLKMAPSDVTGASGWSRALSDEPAQTGMWTHLLGTFDAATGDLVLYVDGVRQEATGHLSTPWKAEGPLMVGGGRTSANNTEHWRGGIDDVRVWDRVLTDDAHFATDGEQSEVWRLANRPLALEGRWRLDETEGTAVADSSDHGLTATLHADPLTAWNETLNEVTLAPGVTLDATREEHVRTDAPAVRTDRSYTVASWVRLDEVGHNSTAIAQEGEEQSAFYLGYQHTLDHDNWVMKLPPRDRTGAVGWHRSLSNQTVEFGRWTHLAATYDHTRGEATLFVDGIAQEPVAVPTAWHANGDVVIGGAQFEKSFFDPWSGDISDVHLYQGVLDEDEIRTVLEGISPAPSL